MGRSVETVGDNVIYFDASEFCTDDEFENECLWDDLEQNLKYEIETRFSSIGRVTKQTPYPYRENRIILENDFVCVSMSEYCGRSAVSVYVNPDCEIPELAEYWIKRSYYPAIREIVKQNMVVLNRVGTFSNGCAVFRKED